MSLFGDITGEASDVWAEIFEQPERVELVPPKGDSKKVAAFVGPESQSTEDIEQRGTVRRRMVYLRTVRVRASVLTAAYGGDVPSDSWDVEVDGELWNVDRVSGLGAAVVSLYLKRHGDRRLGRKHY